MLVVNNCCFVKKGALLFNTFKLDANLVDLPMGGRKFTRMNKFGTKLSKIDILVLKDFILKLSKIALPSDLSDHCPLILKTHAMDYGPIPFKLFFTLGSLIMIILVLSPFPGLS